MKIGMVCAAAFYGFSVAAAFAASTETWYVDPVHSGAVFTATHFGITRVGGTIPITSAVIQTPTSGRIPVMISAELAIAAIDTKNEKRDADLKSDHFFDVVKYPRMSFRSTSIKAAGDKTFTVVGDLTMHGVTKPVTLAGRFDGEAKNFKGKPIVAYEATGTIDRRDWNITYGSPVVSNDISLNLSVEADEQPAR
jgi:polyisoprenoid-binding protein YceI